MLSNLELYLEHYGCYIVKTMKYNMNVDFVLLFKQAINLVGLKLNTRTLRHQLKLNSVLLSVAELL